MIEKNERLMYWTTQHILTSVNPIKGLSYQYFPYSELMRLTLISSPFRDFVTSIFLDQLPHLNSTKSLKNKCMNACWEYQCSLSLFYITGMVSRQFLQEDHSVVRVSDDERDIVVVRSCSLGEQLRLVFQSDLHHDLRCCTAIPGKLQNTDMIDRIVSECDEK